MLQRSIKQKMPLTCKLTWPRTDNILVCWGCCSCNITSHYVLCFWKQAWLIQLHRMCAWSYVGMRYVDRKYVKMKTYPWLDESEKHLACGSCLFKPQANKIRCYTLDMNLASTHCLSQYLKILSLNLPKNCDSGLIFTWWDLT